MDVYIVSYFSVAIVVWLVSYVGMDKNYRLSISFAMFWPIWLLVWFIQMMIWTAKSIVESLKGV